MPSSIVSTMNSIWKKMRRKPYRDAFVASHVSETVSSQIALLRAARGWTQQQLAEKTGMKQSRISALEDPNYENFEIGTLRRLASAFDVGLTLRFSPFSEIVKWSVTLGEYRLVIPHFAEDDIESNQQEYAGYEIEIDDRDIAPGLSKIISAGSFGEEEIQGGEIVFQPKADDKSIFVPRTLAPKLNLSVVDNDY